MKFFRWMKEDGQGSPKYHFCKRMFFFIFIAKIIKNCDHSKLIYEVLYSLLKYVFNARGRQFNNWRFYWWWKGCMCARNNALKILISCIPISEILKTEKECILEMIEWICIKSLSPAFLDDYIAHSRHLTFLFLTYPKVPRVSCWCLYYWRIHGTIQLIKFEGEKVTTYLLCTIYRKLYAAPDLTPLKKKTHKNNWERKKNLEVPSSKILFLAR